MKNENKNKKGFYIIFVLKKKQNRKKINVKSLENMNHKRDREIQLFVNGEHNLHDPQEFDI
jgi:diphthamide synthase subunit DPH2